MKHLWLLSAAILLCSLLVSCGETKILHCDHCGKEIKVSAASNMEEDWIVYCKDCESELGLDTIVPEK